MIYVISDIHGCYEEYKKLLQKINFSDTDKLYILGDVVDRGPEPIKVLQDMMVRPNVHPILGNHDYAAWKVLRKLNVEIREDTLDGYLKEEDLLDYFYWIQDGGSTTVKKFKELDFEDREEILDYFQDFALYEEVFLNEKRFVLVHAGLNEFSEEKDWDDYALEDFLFYRADYDKRYFEDKNTFLITGHTPTFRIREDGQPLVYEKDGHIAIDCGCVYGKRLAAYCLDTGKAEYVDAVKPDTTFF